MYTYIFPEDVTFRDFMANSIVPFWGQFLNVLLVMFQEKLPVCSFFCQHFSYDVQCTL